MPFRVFSFTFVKQAVAAMRGWLTDAGACKLAYHGTAADRLRKACKAGACDFVVRNTYTVLALALAMAFTACHDDDDEGGESAQQTIAFSSELPSQGTTRAGIALWHYQEDMKLYGTKTLSGTEQVVFPSYRLQYLKNSTQTWEYEADRDASLTGQIAKYWDTQATQYYFIAGAPYAHTTIDTQNKAVTLDGLKYESSSASGTTTTAYLYSDPKTVTSADFGNTVMLQFHLALARIKVGFKFAAAQSGAEGKIVLSNIGFKPSGSFAAEGSLKVDYTTSPLTYTVTPTSTMSDQLDYTSVEITYPGNVTTTYATEVYYMLPISSAASACDWTMTIGSLLNGSNPISATVPAADMKWEPGHQYEYIFEINSVNTDSNLKYVSFVATAVSDWETATDSEPEVYNW